jgi:tRNA(Ile)-lysidine synthase
VSESATDRIERTITGLASGDERLVLAVSGGLDSMVLLQTAARVAPGSVAAVATFDHATGPHSAAAAGHVARTASALGLPSVIGRSAVSHRDEAGWRRERWRFLREVTRSAGGVIVTAHTEDDQAETVLMRAMRGSGTRGLAGLLAPLVGVARPFLTVSRAEIRQAAAKMRIRHFADPTNASRAYLRNRIRLDIMPALLSADPALRGELLDIGRRAARWRVELERMVGDMLPPLRGGGRSETRVASAPLQELTSQSLAVVWPVIAARVGVALDRRGIARLVELTERGRIGSAVQISGGWQVRRLDEEFELTRGDHPLPGDAELDALAVVEWGEWSFRAAPDDGSSWSATLPAGRSCVVRSWAPGDRMRVGGGTFRKVKRLLSDAGIRGSRRVGWPVVLVDGEIRWIPGVGRSDAATERSGRPGVSFHCDRGYG